MSPDPSNPENPIETGSSEHQQDEAGSTGGVTESSTSASEARVTRRTTRRTTDRTHVTEHVEETITEPIAPLHQAPTGEHPRPVG